MTKEQIEAAVSQLIPELSEEGCLGEEPGSPEILTEFWESYSVYDLGNALIVLETGGGDDPYVWGGREWYQPEEIVRGKL